MSETVQSQGRPLAQAVRGELLERKSGAGRELAYWQGGHSSLHPGDSEWRPGSTVADEEHLMESEVRVRGTGGRRTQSVPEAGAEDGGVPRTGGVAGESRQAVVASTCTTSCTKREPHGHGAKPAARQPEA